MNRPIRLATLLTLAAFVLLATAATAQGRTYRVTITNVTQTQILSPPVVAAHSVAFDLFAPGSPASDELAALAEDGDTEPMAAMLTGHPDVVSFAVGDEMIPPGGSATVEVESRGRFVFLSLATMLVTTNDAFAGLRQFDLRGGRRHREVLVQAWDAGTEENNEDCDFIPGPPCGNPFVRATEGAEGFVAIHPGIRGIGDLEPEVWDWKNPVAHVRVVRSAGGGDS